MDKDNFQDSIIIFPEYKKLKKEIVELRAELTKVVLERDELLYVECKNIEMTYMLSLGHLEYKAYKLECMILRLKRKTEMIQAKKNRQEKINVTEIEQILDEEFTEYQAVLNQQIEKMNRALDWNKSRTLSKEEALELKKLYRMIVKELHPDFHTHASEAGIRLFHYAVKAYEDGNIEELRIISIMVSDSGLLLDEETNSLLELKKEKERLSDLLQSIQDGIADIKTKYPYTLKKTIHNSEEIHIRKTELTQTIEQSTEILAIYKQKLEEMMR